MDEKRRDLIGFVNREYYWLRATTEDIEDCYNVRISEMLIVECCNINSLK